MSRLVPRGGIDVDGLGVALEFLEACARSFGERATALGGGCKRELDRNRSTLHKTRRQLACRGHRLNEVRILDIVIWSVLARGEP